MKVKLKVGVIGVGHLGSLHAKMYAQIESCDLKGVYDIQSDRAASAAAEYKTTAFADTDALLDAVDAVSIVAVTQQHFDVAQRALRRGKHVFIEKPISETIQQARDLVAMGRAANLKIQVGHIERFNPAVLAVEPYHIRPLFIESHRLAQFNPRGSDVAVVLDLMIHDIDLILSLVKSPVERIDANGVAVVSESIDIANARIQFQSGCVANVTASRVSQNKMRKMRLFQQDAYIGIDFAQGLAEVFRLVDENAADISPTLMLGKIEQGSRKRVIVYEQPEVQEVNALKVELASFITSIQEDHDPPVTGEDGLQALEVAQEILAIIQGQKIQRI